jgi:hypothetical protein
MQPRIALLLQHTETVQHARDWLVHTDMAYCPLFVGIVEFCVVASHMVHSGDSYVSTRVIVSIREFRCRYISADTNLDA